MENFIKRAFSSILLAPMTIFAFMEEPQVVKGWADPNNLSDPKVQNIQYKDKTVINCSKFNIAKDETVHFINEDKKTSVLCRVTGKNPSIIEGTLKADGRLILINPCSIVFRETAKVNVYQFFASTLDMRDEDFLRDKYKFSLAPGAENSCIVNLGIINADQTVLMAPQMVHNKRTIKGKVAFLGGKDITINFEGDEKFSFVIDEPLQSGFIEIAGTIEAKEKDVLIRHRVAKHLISSVLNANGLIEATTMVKENGIVRLMDSSIVTNNLEVKGGIVESNVRVLLGDVQKKRLIGSAEFEADKELRWKGGEITHKDVDLKTLKTLKLCLKAPVINLYKDVTTKDTGIIFDGPVIIRNDLNIVGNNGTYILFNSSLNSDSLPRNLSIDNGSGDFKTLEFKANVGDISSFSSLKINTGVLKLQNIGGKLAGAKQLSIKASKEVHCLGNNYFANQQSWDTINIHLNGEKEVWFNTEGSSLAFGRSTKLFLAHDVLLNMVTRGGELDLPHLSGCQSSVKIDVGNGKAKLGDISGCSLSVYGRDIRLSNKIEVINSSMEAEKSIRYKDKAQSTAINATGHMFFIVKNGTIGLEDKPLQINTPGKLYVGGKSTSYFKGKCLYHEFLSDSPIALHLEGTAYHPIAPTKLMDKEKKLESIAPDLDHLAPHGFVDEATFTPQRAPLFYLKRIPKLIGTGEEDSVTEKTER